MRSIRAVLIATSLLVAPALAGSAAAAVFVVNSTGDASDASAGNGACATSGGVCTLRAAIQESNALAAGAPHTVQFAIGLGQQTIAVGAALPTITRAVVIDAWTQPGFSGAPLIVLSGGSGDGIKVTSGGATVRGLVINGFSGSGIVLSGAGNNVVEGNYIGTNAAGTARAAVGGPGILIDTSKDNRIGGRDKSQRNLISGSDAKGADGGVKIDGGSTGNIVQGNFIGSDITGTQPIGNEGRGVAIHSGSNNFIGGAQPGAGNLIIGNRATGVRVVSGTGNLVMGNYIGLTAAGTYEYGVTSNARGIQFRSDNNTAANNLVVGNLYDGILMYEGSASNNLMQGNIIVGNGMHGIDVVTGSGNRMSANRMWGNGNLGISVVNASFSATATPNDACDADTGTNGRQNYPVLSSASTAGAVSGSLNSRPNEAFTVQFFASATCDASGYGEAQFFLGQVPVATNTSCNGSFGVSLGTALSAGWVVSATATDSAGNTSELSQCALVR